MCGIEYEVQEYHLRLAELFSGWRVRQTALTAIQVPECALLWPLPEIYLRHWLKHAGWQRTCRNSLPCAGRIEMELSEKDKQALQQILEYETSTPPEKWQLGWSWDMVHIWPATLNRLLNMGLLEVVFHSNSYRGMKLTTEGRAMAQNLRQEAPETSEMLTQAMVCLPNDLFNDIIGHDEVKEMLIAALSALKPVHVLLAGPPALAKTLFLWDIERVYGESALWLLGSATSKAGLWDVIGERQPRVLLIDEIDRMSAVDAAGLLSLMEGGRLVRAKKAEQWTGQSLCGWWRPPITWKDSPRSCAPALLYGNSTLTVRMNITP